jgi:small-conductance mechanosensitive channel
LNWMLAIALVFGASHADRGPRPGWVVVTVMFIIAAFFVAAAVSEPIRRRMIQEWSPTPAETQMTRLVWISRTAAPIATVAAVVVLVVATRG